MTPLAEFIGFTEVDDGAFFAGELFQRKFGSPPPPAGHHLAAFFRASPSNHHLLGYAHFHAYEELILVGGVCTDGRVFEHMSAAQREAVTAAGGVYFNLLTFGFARFAEQCRAYFGYCGDARAEVVNLQAGFRKTEHRHLLVNFHRPLPEAEQHALIAKAAAIGPF